MRRTAILSALLLLTTTATAQTIYVDLQDSNGPNNGVPVSYGAVNGANGFWNGVDFVGLVATGAPVALTGFGGGLPVATLTYVGPSQGVFPNVINAGCLGWGTTTEFALYDGGRLQLPYELRFDGLDPGSYTVYTFGYVDGMAQVTDVQPVGFPVRTILNTCPSSGVHSEPQSYVTHQVVPAATGQLRIGLSTPYTDPETAFNLSGFQLVFNGSPSSVGTLFCPGDGTTGGVGGCGCGNNHDGSNTADAGCANSANAGGALLQGFGSASVTSDNLTMQVTGAVPAGSYGTPSNSFWLESQTINNPTMPFLGDGSLCIMNYRRVAAPSPDASGVVMQGQTATLLGASPGTTSYIQLLYPDPNGPCGSGWNLSNGLEINWTN